MLLSTTLWQMSTYSYLTCGRREGGNILFNDTLNTFYLRIYGVRHMVEETRCRHIDYSFWLAGMVLLYASSHRQDNTYHSLCYTSRGALAGTITCGSRKKVCYWWDPANLYWGMLVWKFHWPISYSFWWVQNIYISSSQVNKNLKS